MSPAYKRPESVLVVIYSDTGEILLLRRRDPPDFWQSVTGSLEWGERADAAARRELREETGLGEETELGTEYRLRPTDRVQRFPILPAWRKRYAPDVRENTEYLFVLRLPRPLPVRLNPAEHTEYAWLSCSDALARVSSWTNRDAIEELMQAQGVRGDL